MSMTNLITTHDIIETDFFSEFLEIQIIIFFRKVIIFSLIFIIFPDYIIITDYTPNSYMFTWTDHSNFTKVIDHLTTNGTRKKPASIAFVPIIFF